MSKAGGTIDECKLCGSRFSSCSNSKEERNRKRQIEEVTFDIYAIVQVARKKAFCTFDYTCTPCRDKLRRLFENYIPDQGFPPKIIETFVNGSAFPRRNLKRKGTSVKKRKPNQMKSRETNASGTVPSPQSTCQREHTSFPKTPTAPVQRFNSPRQSATPPPTSGKLNSAIGSQATGESQLDKAPLSVKDCFGPDGILDVDEGALRQAILDSTLTQSSNRSQMDNVIDNSDDGLETHNRDEEQGHPTDCIEDHNKMKKAKLFSEDKNEVSSEHQESENDFGFLLNRLRAMYDSGNLFAKTSSINEDEQQQLSNPLIMNLWKITKFPFIYESREFINVKQSISVMVKFLHTGLVAKEDVKEYLRCCGVPIVNHYVVGLFLVEGMSGMSLPEIKILVSHLPPNAPSIIVKMLKPFDHAKSSNRKWIMSLYHIIDKNWETYEDGFLMDMEQEGNYTNYEKKCFFHLVYYQLAFCLNSSALSILLSRLMTTVEKNDNEFVELEYTDSDGVKNMKIYPHALLLLLLQNRDFESFPDDVERVKESFLNLTIKKDQMLSFVKMLFKTGSTQRTTLENMSYVVVVQLSLAFRLDKPLSIFYNNSIFTTPYALNLALKLYEKTTDLAHLCELPLEASRLLTWEKFSKVEPRQLVSIMRLDELRINEKQLFDFVIDYASKSSRKRQVLDTLLPYIRFATMTDQEFKLVSTHPYLKDDEKDKFWLHIKTDIRPILPKKFFRATIARLK